MTLTNQVEPPNRPQENNPVQVDSQEAGSQQENGAYQQVHYQRMLNRDRTNKEETIPKQQALNVLHQKKTKKTQAVQVNETNREEGQTNRVALNRPSHPRSVEEEYLRKEPFFVNHYYSHPVRQCCC